MHMWGVLERCDIEHKRSFIPACPLGKSFFTVSGLLSVAFLAIWRPLVIKIVDFILVETYLLTLWVRGVTICLEFYIHVLMQIFSNFEV